MIVRLVLALIGIVAGVSLTKLPAETGFLAYSGEGVIWAGGSVIALGLMGALSWWMPKLQRDLSPTQVRERLCTKFPTAAPPSVDWLDVPPSLAPAEWMLANEVHDHDAMTRLLERQVTDPVDPGVLTAIVCCLQAAGSGTQKARDGIDELARRMWKTNGDPSSFEVEQFLEWLQRTYPSVEFEMPYLDGLSGSPYGVIHVIEAIRRARDNGVGIAAAEFLWVRLIDRRLWVVIDNIGRQQFLVEGLGPMAHFAAEKKNGRPLQSVDVSGARRGLDECLLMSGMSLAGAAG